MSQEMLSKEHNGNNTVKGKRVFVYGWDYTNLQPLKIRCTSNGKVEVNG